MTSRRENMFDAIFWASIVIIGIMTFLPHYAWNDQPVPYGIVWWFLNFDFKNYLIYSFQLTGIQLVIQIPQYFLVRKGIINRELFTLNLFTTALYRVAQIPEDVTVIMFQPLVVVSPLLSILMILQKAPIGYSWNLSDPVAHNWFGQIKGNSILNFGYLSLIFWFILPLVYWLVKKI